MIHGVTGPNEYENNISNNWYTNTIAAWVLALHARKLFNVSKKKRYAKISDDELAQLARNCREYVLPSG